MSPKKSLKEELSNALSRLGRTIGQPLALNNAGSCGLRIGHYPVPVTIEWIETARCVAVHAPFPRMLPARDMPKIAYTLMMSHLAGAYTMGCSYWLTPDAEVVVGVTLLGPTLDEDMLLEAIGRVCKHTEMLQKPPKGMEDLA